MSSAEKAGPVDTALVQEVLGLTMALMREMQAHFSRRVEAAGVPMVEVMALWRLREDGAMPMRSMADCLHVDPSQVTALVDRLEERGYAERRPHPDDRRIKLVGLTDPGTQFLAELWGDLHQDAPGLAALDRADLVELRRILRAAGLGEGGQSRPAAARNT